MSLNRPLSAKEVSASLGTGSSNAGIKSSEELAKKWTSRVSTTDDPPTNFTPHSQQVLALSRREADRFNHNFVGTEHLLMGLIALDQGCAVNVLKKMGLNLETVRAEVEKQIGAGPQQRLIGNIPYTPRVKKVLGLAAKEAKMLGHTYVGTEHILLGLLHEGDGVAARVLKNLGVDIEKTRVEILKELDPNFNASTFKAESLPAKETPKPSVTPIDATKRYDVYCSERNRDVVVYRNALFKGMRKLCREERGNSLSDFYELEQADGHAIYVAVYSVIKFCAPGTTPNSENVPGQQP